MLSKAISDYETIDNRLTSYKAEFLKELTKNIDA